MFSEIKKREYFDECFRIVKFIIPLIATGILQLLYNAADSVVVGYFDGAKALAAVSSTSSLVNLIINLFIGLTVGATVCVAHDFGAGDHEGVHKTIHTSVTIGLMGGIFVALVGFFFSKTFLEWMQSPTDVIGLSTTYLKIYFLGAPAMLTYNFCASSLRSVGDTKRPLIFLSLSGLVNVGLNVILVAVFHLGVIGVAVATIVSQYVSLVLILIYMIKTNDVTKLYLSKLKIHLDKLKFIFRIGVPAGLQGSMFSISNVIIQSSINSFDYLAMAGSGASASIEGFTYTAMNSVYSATMTFVGQSVGAKKYHRIPRIFGINLVLVTVLGLLFGWTSYIFGEPLISLYLPDDPLAVPYGMLRLKYIALPYFLCGVMEVITGAVRGMGMSFIPMLNAFVGTCLFRVLWIFLVFERFRSLEIIYISYLISWILTSIAHYVCYLIKYNSLKKKSKHTEG